MGSDIGRTSKAHRLAYDAFCSLRKTLIATLGLLMLAGSVAAEQITIAALGNSLIHGYGLPQQQGYVPQLESWLRQRGHDVTVINAGVSGDTTAGGLARVDWTLTSDIDGLIVGLGGNDMLRGIDPKAVRSNLSGILKTAKARNVEVMLIGFQAPGNFGPGYKDAFDRIYPDLSSLYGAVLSTSFLSGLKNPPDLGSLQSKYMQPDGLHPNAGGVKLMVQATGPNVEKIIARIEAGT
jgi:acyl-CoA thioesterase-1